MKKIILLGIAIALSLPVCAQFSRLGKGVEYKGEVSGTFSGGDHAPFWLTENKFGLSSIENNSAYLRGSLIRPIEMDSLRKWRIGYGVDLAVPVNYTSHFIVQQLYADFQYKLVRLTVGQKEYGLPMKNDLLSSGGMTFGINARPIPQVRFELPDWWNISAKAKLVFIKGHLAYGMTTDNHWKDNFVGDWKTNHRRISHNVLYHSKAGYLKVGNVEKFPLEFVGGFEMVTQFGGEAWNLSSRFDDGSGFDGHMKTDNILKAMWHAFIPGGRDVTDGNYSNAEGNFLGSWNMALSWTAPTWKARAYMEHYYEDHSQLFFQYGWKDMLWGVEAELPKNPYLSGVVYEFIKTADQSGPVYHDKTDKFPVQISGRDNYYNHNIYGGYQHWGQTLGNPLMVSPIYNNDGAIYFNNNRIKSHHIGLSGNPCNDLSWRLLYSHTRSLGTYDRPAVNPRHMDAIMAEVTYKPHQLKGWQFKAAYGGHFGDIIGKSNGAQLTVTKTGIIGKKK